ncbi:Calcineurin-like phosphoesterase [Planctomycetes bacterium Poly30]|uniref:Calcineurin-like phosphoesterase n=1 Tax=Saltatorellus ferox TaxID=2528018 RepID=A0A518EQB6_9BACT|nr:Calcineurin-like phosphoesterase [Planctomycetes bacterium Poly30]
MIRGSLGVTALLSVPFVVASWSPDRARSASAAELLLELDGQGRLGGSMAGRLRRESRVEVAPLEAGGGTIFNVADDAFVAEDFLELPTSAFTVEGWVAVETPRRWGGILGAIEDNGAFEKGWLLGYDDSAFTFGISTASTDDGDGRLVYLRAASPYLVGRWHHVAATYDGSTSRLYVDGVLSAESTETQGPALMSDSARLTVGAYRDSDEFYPHDGRLADLRFYDRALDEPELQAAAAEGADRAGREPWTDALFEWTIPPYLTWPRTDGVSVLAETRLPGLARLYVRMDDERAWVEFEPATPTPSTIHEFVVRGLEPDTKYFYRMSATEAIGGRQETTVDSETRSFRTAPDRDDRAFTFTVVGDTQSQGDVAKRVSDLAFEHRPNFVVHCGDLVDTGSTHADWTDTFFPSMRPLIEHAPLVPVLGNHEQDARLYYDLMSLPEPERWYSLRYGHAEFFLLDGNRSLADQSEQLEWLKGALADSEATWRFAVLHQPPYTSDSDDYGDTTETGSTRGDLNVQNILGLLEAHGVDLCFSGHVHDYERTFPIKDGKVTSYADGGVIYVTAAGGGGHLEDFDATNTWFGHKKMRRHHFVHVAIHGDQLELQAMDEDGRLFDVLALTQRGR